CRAAGQIAYSLLYSIANGDVFVFLFLFPILTEIIPVFSVKEAFKDIDVALLVGAMPRQDGMERKDLLKANVKIFETQGAALNMLCQEDCQATSQIAVRLGLSCKAVKNVTIWGNHSSTQYPDATHAGVSVKDDEWLKGGFVKVVQQRGAAVIKARKLSSAMSAAKGHWVSMGVISDGNNYGVPEGLIYSFPVTIKDKTWTVVEGLSINPFSREKMDESAKELVEERDMALEFLSKSA
uniref:Malate dehydrogenase, cytoplasmic n=1 Tax=Eptatretus burgeri TaxID=7764 RepID=A0A8C4R8E5_EPTBU